MSTPLNPSAILDAALQRALAHQQTGESIISEREIIERVEFVCRNPQNRACTRLLLACLLAKSHQPALDIRKPYTEISGSDCYSGRTYDETYITPFIHEHQLPCNPTTAFLTPALRNKNITLTADLNLDCLGFLRHFLHLFHRRRSRFLEKYQELLLSEPDSAVSQPLKEAFLALRQATESIDTQE